MLNGWFQPTPGGMLFPCLSNSAWSTKTKFIVYYSYISDNNGTEYYCSGYS